MLTRPEKAFILKLLERSRSHYELSSPRQYNLRNMDKDYFCFGHYNYAEAANALSVVAELDTPRVMRALFAMITEHCDPEDHFSKWLAVMDFYSSIMRHPQQCEPMLAPGRELMHPLALLLLGEARCGKTARLIRELAMFNGYEARLICLAVHMVAEVFWDGKWHLIDANAYTHPAGAYLRKWGELPSAQALAAHPQKLDSLPIRSGWCAIKDHRTLDGKMLKRPPNSWPPFTMKTSSHYFAREYFHNRFSATPTPPRKGMTVCVKKHDFAGWEKLPKYGWEKASYTEEAIPMLPMQTIPDAPELAVPNIFYGSSGAETLPISFYPVEFPVYDYETGNFAIKRADAYEIRVSSHTRGWDYDYPLFERLPEPGAGDVFTTRAFQQENGMLTIAIPKEKFAGCTQIYIEASSFADSQLNCGDFVWPSREYRVRIA